MRGNLILIGMMGCGKSTVAALLARRLGWELADTDSLVEAREGCSIPALFAQRGEGYFRDCERQVSEELSRRTGLVIACGGGLPLREDCIGPLRESGTVLFLRRSPEEIYDKVSMAGRPLGQQGREAFLARYAKREPVYRACAHHQVEVQAAPEETAARILEVLT